MVKTTEQALETVPWWAGNAQLTTSLVCLSLYGSATFELEVGTELPEICDAIDMTIAVLEGEGSLILNEELIPLELGRFVFIPAHLPYTVQTQTSLTFLLSRCESDPGLHDSAWIINL